MYYINANMTLKYLNIMNMNIMNLNIANMGRDMDMDIDTDMDKDMDMDVINYTEMPESRTLRYAVSPILERKIKMLEPVRYRNEATPLYGNLLAVPDGDSGYRNADGGLVSSMPLPSRVYVYI
jgi:hypothetical protein